MLKNVIDWASRDREQGSLMGKPVTIIGAGGRAGTASAQMQLLEILGEAGPVATVKAGILIQASVPDTFDANENVIDKKPRN